MDMGEDGRAGIPPASVSAGEMLRAARDRHGLSLDEVAARTRIPVRHLEAVELGDYARLPAQTYAVGFARAYARAAGADEVEVAQKVRADVQRLGRRIPEYEPFEVADPARVPSRAVAVMGVGVALAILVLLGLWYGTTLGRGRPSAGDAGVVASAPATVTKPVPPRPAAAPVSGGQVTLTATDEVWMRVYDAGNKVLFQATMKPGDKFDVPAGADRPMINVGRPDKIAVTLNGAAMKPLGVGQLPVKDVRVDGAAVAARQSGQPLADAAPTATAAAPPAAHRASTRAERPRRSAAPRLTETQRANLEAAGSAPSAVANTSAP